MRVRGGEAPAGGVQAPVSGGKREGSSPSFSSNFCAPLFLFFLCEIKAQSFREKKEKMVYTEDVNPGLPKGKVDAQVSAAVRRFSEKEKGQEGRETGENSFSLCLFPLFYDSSAPLGKGGQNVEEHHKVDRDHGGPSGEHEAPRVVQRDAPRRSEERGDESFLLLVIRGLKE